MSKIIIENRSNLSMPDVLDYISHVISEGRVSETSKGKQYCFITTWKNGIIVYADKNKKSDRFIVMDGG